MRTALLFVLLTAASGCTERLAGERLRAEAYAVADQCGLAGRVDFTLHGQRELAITNLDPTARYQDVDCLLAALRPLGPRLGFIGNEAPR
ncbi:MAG: hypothetical protein M3N07_07285 [Pseudomonadota bacterium]|nr:hypothetical protein [Pseudomonadota bacterium]